MLHLLDNQQQTQVVRIVMHQTNAPGRSLPSLPFPRRSTSAGHTHQPVALRPSRSSTRPGAKIAALQIDQTPTFVEVKREAEAAFAKAAGLLPAVDRAEADLDLKQSAAEDAEQLAKDAEAHAAELGPHAETALREARQATAKLHNQHEEISSADLHVLAESLLSEWKTEAQPDSLQEASEMEVGISGISAVLIAHTAAAVVKGKRYLVAAIVIGERFPEGALEGTAVHWGCSAPGRGGNWEPPPPGWHTLPPVSHPAGRAWQTPFGTYLPVIKTAPVASDPAYGLVLQLPAEGLLQNGGGLSFVLKRPPGTRPEWLQTETRRDFSVSLEQAYEHLVSGDKPEKEDDSLKAVARSARTVVSEVGDQTSAASTSRRKSEVQQWVKRAESDEAPGQPSAESGGPLLQQYNAAVGFLQSMFSKTTERGGESAAKTAEEEYRKAKQMFSSAHELIKQAEAAKQAASTAREDANNAHRAVQMAQERLQGLQLESVVAVRSARAATARLSGRNQEVGLLELNAIAEARLRAWLGWMASRRSLEQPPGTAAPEQQAAGPGDDLGFHNFWLHGMDGRLSACVTLAEEGGRHFAVISLAAAEAFPEGVLEGVVAHWGIAGVGRRGGWENPPPGWVSDPDTSKAAGGGATESRLEQVAVPGQEGKPGVVAHALTLQLPLEGPVRKGGIKLVLRTADDAWLGCSFQGSRHDFFISLQQIGAKLAAQQKEAEPEEEAAVAGEAGPAAGEERQQEWAAGEQEEAGADEPAIRGGTGAAPATPAPEKAR